MIKDVTLTRGLNNKLTDTIEIAHDMIKAGPMYYGVVLIGPLEDEEEAFQAGRNLTKKIVEDLTKNGCAPDGLTLHRVKK